MNALRWGAALRYLLVVVVIGLASIATPLHANPELDYLPGEVVVKLWQSSDLLGVAADYQLDPIPLDQFGTRPIYRLRILDGVDPQAKADALAGDGRVQYAEPNFLEETPEGRQRMSWSRGGSAGEYAQQWAGPKMNLPAAHSITRGAGVTVAVLDTGIDPGHAAFAGRLVAGYDFVAMDSNPSEEGNANQHLAYGHGTHVAGLVALAAPDAKIMPVRVLDPNGIGNIWVLAEALAYAVNPDGNLNTDDGAHVINLSLSTLRPTNLLEEIITDITCSRDDDDDGGDDGEGCLAFNGRGAVVVAAAGNRGSDVPEYPAAEAVNGVLAVAASTESDTLATFSNHGAWVHVTAPGERIISTIPGNQYAVWNGTSMAAPLAAGEAALVWAVQPTWDAQAVVEHLIATAMPIAGAVPYRLDAAEALGVVVTPVLTINGTAATDDIQLQVGPTTGQVVVLKAPGMADGTRFIGVRELVVDSGNGTADKVTIKAELSGHFPIKFNAGSGGDEVQLETKTLPGVANLQVAFSGGAGNNKLAWLVPSASQVLTVGLTMSTTTGNDEVLVAVDAGAPSTRLALQLNTNLGAANDKLETFIKSAANVVNLTVNARSGAGNDLAKVELDQVVAGRTTATLNLLLDGGSDSGEILLKGSQTTTTLRGALNGGGSNDTLNVLTEGPTRGSFRVTGGAGLDSCSATYGTVTACESAQQSRSLLGVQQHRAYLALVIR